MSRLTIALLVGSLRKGSFNRQMAEAFAKLAPENLTCRIVEIGDLPFYNQDLETETPPAAWTTFREALKASDGLMFFTPEYNRSISGVLKNAIDVASRPYGKGAINGRPAGVISVSPGALGAFGANHHLRQILVGVGVPVMAAPEAYIGGAGGLFAEDGAIKVDSTREFVQNFAVKFAEWVARHKQG